MNIFSVALIVFVLVLSFGMLLVAFGYLVKRMYESRFVFIQLLSGVMIVAGGYIVCLCVTYIYTYIL